MTAGKYSIGIDFGTLSARAMLFDIRDGRAVAKAECPYAHGVMQDALPNGTPLPADWALQHPKDYLDALDAVLPPLLRESGVAPVEIVGMGVDFTSCTVLPVTDGGTPLCFMPEYAENPHAYVKLWKHHGAKQYAEQINHTARALNANWLSPCGGAVSPEWLLPKLLQIYMEAPDVFQVMAHFIEAGDWLVWQLTGRLLRNSAAAGFVANWRDREGYPPREHLNAIAPGFGDGASEKLKGIPLPPGTPAGGLLPDMAARYGLLPGTPVGVAHMDSQAAMAAVGAPEKGMMLAIMGTSTVYLLLDDEERSVPGIGCVVKDGVIPGFYGYSAGQSCVGEHFAWAAQNCCPPEYHREAADRGIPLQALLTEKAAKQRPGEHGLLALDWFNGNRSILLDMELTGLILGLTLRTKPEDIYRALIEATAYGARVIIENFRANGTPVDAFYASGGIPGKNPMAMQIYADVLQMPIYIADSPNGPALGAGILGAVAGGAYPSIAAASAAMGRICPEPYLPNEAAVPAYEALFQEYRKLHDHFGRDEAPLMHRLRALRKP